MLGHMVRLRPDGSKLTWRVAAMSKFDAPGREAKPFFITWDNPEIRPDKVRTRLHRNQKTVSTRSPRLPCDPVLWSPIRAAFHVEC